MPEQQLPHTNALDTAAEVPGLLRQWLRSSGGEWLGLVDYEIPFADGRHKGVYVPHAAASTGVWAAAKKVPRLTTARTRVVACMARAVPLDEAWCPAATPVPGS